MFAKNTNFFKRIFSFNLMNFSQHSKVIIIGAGTGGISTAKQMIQGKNFKKTDITIFDPQSIHYYQPGFTKIAGLHGMDKLLTKHIIYDIKEITNDFNFKNWAISDIDPENNSVVDQNGEKWTYDYLIVAAGLKVDLDSIPGN